MTLPWYYTLEEAHREVDALDQLAKVEFDNEIEFFIHSDPCLPLSCKICEIKMRVISFNACLRIALWFHLRLPSCSPGFESHAHFIFG